MAIRCIAFDLDDTLWECQPVLARAEQHLYNWLQVHHSVITDRYSLSDLVKSRTQFMRQRPKLEHDLGLLRRQWLQWLAEDNGCDPGLVAPAFHAFWTARNQVQFFPDVLEQLQILHARYRLGVITNGNADVDQVGIGHLFHFKQSSADAGVAKPHPAIFQQALEKAGVAAHETVYIGDDLEKDMIGAHHAGLRTIWFNPSQKQKPANVQTDAVMTTFTELVRLIELL